MFKSKLNSSTCSAPPAQHTASPRQWEALPPQTRATLTELIMRLILDTGTILRPRDDPPEVRHDV